MTPELLAQIAAVIIATTALYKAWGGARKDELDALRVIIDEIQEDNRRIRDEKLQLEIRLNQMQTDLSAVQAENVTLRGKIEVLERENAELREELEQRRRGKRDTGALKGQG